MKLNPFAMIRVSPDGTVLVFNPQNQRIMRLNDTGFEIWKAIDADKSIDEIVEMLTAQYNVDCEQALVDLNGFIETLRLRGLLEK